jgi:hypothetical protein
MQVVFYCPNHYFKKGAMPMQKQAIENLQPITAESTNLEPNHTITKRIGSTNFIVRVFFNSTAKESVSDKILRIIKNEIANEA